MKETVKIDLDVLAKQVEQGMKKDALAKHYGIAVSQMGKALKDAGLKIRKFHVPAYEIVTNKAENLPSVDLSTVVNVDGYSTSEDTVKNNTNVDSATEDTDNVTNINDATWV